MTNTETPSTPSSNSKPRKSKNNDITRIKAPKSHKYRGVDVHKVVIVGFDTDKDLHDAELVELGETNPKFLAGMTEGVWCLCDDESNATEPSDNLVASIRSKNEVEVAGKLLPVPLTKATEHLAYVDEAGKVWPFYFAVVYGRKRTRADRELGTGMTFKVETGNLKSAASDMLIENLVRRSFTPTVEAEKLAKLAEGGMSLQEIAGKLGEHGKHGKTPTDRTVANKLKLVKLTAAVAKMVDSGELKVTNAYSVAELPKGKQADAARQVIENKLTTAQTKALVKEITGEKPSGGKPVETDNLSSDDSTTPDAGEQPSGESTASKSKPEEPKAPTFDSIEMTKTQRPKAADIDEMIEYLIGDRSPMRKRAPTKLAAAALQWVRGNMTEDEFLYKAAALYKVNVDQLAPLPEEPEAE
jgi:ParB-like chromosome segregation protein Spo0J